MFLWERIGLQIFNRSSGEWMSVEGRSGGLEPLMDVVVFPGDLLEKLLQGKIRGTVHRVEKATFPRLSLVYELRPRADYIFDASLPLERFCFP